MQRGGCGLTSFGGPQLPLSQRRGGAAGDPLPPPPRPQGPQSSICEGLEQGPRTRVGWGTTRHSALSLSE